MRRLTPVLLVLCLAGMLTSVATASIPSRKWATNARLSDSSQNGVLFVHQPGDWISPLDFYPYYGEFYLHQFATESPSALVRQRFYRFRLSNVGWGLSRRAASLRRALARMMP